MNDDFLRQLRETVASGLKRKTLTKCSRWAENCVIMGGSFPGPIKWDHYPWLKDMHDAESEWVVGQKSAQMGYSISAMNRTFYHMDVHHRSCLYLLPTKTPDASDFSSTRFDPQLELSPHLAKMFSDVKNVGTKRAGSASLYIRGANSRSGLKSIPVGFIVFDEFDEMPQENIPLAIERTSGQLYKQFWAISTPTVPEHGINALFEDSTQEHFVFQCPRCQKHTELIYPDCLVVCGTSKTDPDINKSHIICKECKGVLPHEGKVEFFRNAQWVPMGHSDYNNRGFYINQMYSPTIEPVRLARAFFDMQRDPASEQEFWNSKMGMPHVVDGARVDDTMIEAAISKSNRRKMDKPPIGRMVMMGVDVGKWLHVEISQYKVERMGNDLNIMSDCQVLLETCVLKFEELDQLMKEWQVLQCVIDVNPERRKAYEFACRFWGHVKLCQFGKSMAGKMIEVKPGPDSHTVTVDRTSWLDLALGRFHSKTIALPIDTSQMYKDQIKSPVRIYKKDQYGNPVGDYISVSKNSKVMEDSKNAKDHFAFARLYCEVALPLGACLMTNQSIEKFL
jgi:Bacteriophage tail assembly protein